MELSLIRRWFTARSTIGVLYVDGAWECYTLEDVVREGPKVPGETAIPAGTYQVAITYSPRFKRPLPLVQDVQGFSGIRIHPGNDAGDTEGCILVGLDRYPDRIGRSREAFKELFSKLAVAQLRQQPVTLTITHEPQEDSRVAGAY